MPDKPVIFFSYRRADATGHARSLQEYLSGRFGEERIFFDRSTIESGDVFPETLSQGVEGCAVLLALIGPQWLNVTGADGNRRLDDPGDFVRKEIALALEHGKKVIPILFDDTPVPSDSLLPEPLKPLAACHAHNLRGETYEYKTQRQELVRILSKEPGIPDPFPEAGEAVAGVSAEQLPAIIAAATRDWKALTDEQREEIAALQDRLGVSEGALRAFFQTLGEEEVQPEHLEARLVEIAERQRMLLAEVSADPADEPEIAQLKEQAKAALDAGRLEQADNLFTEMEAAQDNIIEQKQREIEQQKQEIEQQQLDRAATTARRGSVALTRLRYREAAQHFAAAAKRVPPTHPDQVFHYLTQEASARYRQGNEFGDNDALRDAIDGYRALLQHRPRHTAPLDWAMIQNNLGLALRVLGERENGTVSLHEAVVASRAALEVNTRQRAPLLWAAIQNNLGGALARICELESNTERLEEAVTAFQVALEEYTRERVPLRWAMTQNNLGTTLQRLGERESGTERLQEAVTACRAALEERTREHAPLEWALTQHNLGGAIARIGERENGTERLIEAVTIYEKALEELTRKRMPLEWGSMQQALGNALSILGQRENSTEQLKQAVSAYVEALKELTRERVPRNWASIQDSLGSALSILGEQENSTERLKQAVTAYVEALKERTRERVPLDWATTQNNLGNALSSLGERESGTTRLEEAVTAHRAALEERTRERVPLKWAMTQYNLGNALQTLGERESGTEHFEQAATAYRAALEVFEAAKATYYATGTEQNLKLTQTLLAQRRGS